MYKDHEGGAFMHEHSWNLLKYHQKWISTCAKKSANSRKGTKRRRSINASSPINLEEDNTPINLEEDHAPTSEPAFMERPIGRKQAKDLVKKEKAKDNLRVELEELKAMKREAEQRKEERFQLMFSQEEKLIALKEQKERAKQQRDDDKVMAMDLTTLSQVQAEYYKDRQMEISATRARSSK